MKSPLGIQRMQGGVVLWSDAKIGQNVFGGWKLAALTKFLAISKAVTHSRILKRTKKVDKWLLMAIRERHDYVEKGQKNK